MNVLIQAHGLGDTICCTPTLKKLAIIHDSKLKVFSNYPDVFSNLSYIISSNLIEKIKGELVKNIQYVLYSNHVCGEMKHNLVDIRQFASLQCGFQLFPNELHCEYIPSESFNINVPNKYILIHAPNSWPVKTWDVNRWQELCNAINLPIVSVGKDCKTDNEWQYTCNKLKSVLDLTNKTNLDQLWHLCNNAEYVITTDSSILHLAGTTDTEIIYIAMGRDPQLTTPYRNGSQDYKLKIISNNCSWCTSNLKILNNKFKGSLINCQQEKTNENCQPSVDQVLEVING